MAGHKRRREELDDNADASTHKTRLSPSATTSESTPLCLTSSQSEGQDASVAVIDAASAPLELLPAEVLLNIFARCRNPCLSHVSRRLHQTLPPFQAVSKSLAGYAMAALPWTDSYKPAVGPMLHQLPICEVVDELYASPCPEG